MQPKERIVSTITRARTELDEALAELEKLPAVSQSSVRFAAHALNNFLTITGGTVEILQLALTGHPDPDVQTGLATLERATSLMSHTVTQLMAASTAKDVAPRFEPVPLATMVGRFSTFYQRIAARKRIRWQVETTGDDPLALAWTDRLMVAVVLDNLLSNAVKYSFPDKQIRVEVSTEPGAILCRVRDEGPGLSEADQAKLFQPGEMLTPRPTQGEVSNGFGLAVAKEYVEKLGGEIGCESVLGRGACFSFKVPRHREDAPGQAGAAADAPLAEKSADPVGRPDR